MKTSTLNFKEAKRSYDKHDVFRYCVALANEGAGKLVLGVSDRNPRRVVGTQAFQGADKIAKAILEKLGFRVDVEEVSHPDGRVIVFHVPPRPVGTAYSLDGAFLMRSRDRIVAMTEDRLRAIFDEGKPEWELRPARAAVTPLMLFDRWIRRRSSI